MADYIYTINNAFAKAPSLRSRIFDAIEEHPEHAMLFEDISEWILAGTNYPQPAVNGHDQPEEPRAKKRRIDGQSDPPRVEGGSESLVLEVREVSFSLPQRKKLHLGIVEHKSQAGSATYSIQLRNPGTNQVEGRYALSSYAYILRLPVPEKNQKQYNFCLLPASDQVMLTEPIIWTINHGPLKSVKIESNELRKAAPGPENVLEDALNYALRDTSVQLTIPNEEEFASAIRESHRKSDITYHVKAFRGSKEGYLFFLENGIFFGFKKPLSFFPFNEVVSVSYTSVLARTFNLVITVRTSQDAETQEIEYSMIDQQDFAGIDEYVKKHSLQDASLAEARRAKKTGKVGKALEANGDDAADGQTELEKAQAEFEDEEDEQEEDYDPEDDDDSGSDSESDDGEYTRGKGRNLIAEELGSEAEDVSASEGEEDAEENVEEDAEDVDEGEDEGEVRDPQNTKISIPTHSVKHMPGAPDFDDDDQL